MQPTAALQFRAAALFFLMFARLLRSQQPINVCLIATAGWVECDPNLSSSSYTGLDVELFRIAASSAGWQEGVTYQFVCYGQDAGWSALARKLGTNGTMSACAVAAGSFALTSTRKAMGLQPSYPYYRTGLGVLVSDRRPKVDMFAFIRPFTAEVWFAFLLTVLVVPVIAFVVEQLLQEGELIMDWDTAHEARAATYRTFLAVFNLEIFPVRSLPAQALLIAFCFLNLIVMATYIANLAAAIASDSMATGFGDVMELRGRRVAVHSAFETTLMTSYGVESRPLDFDGRPTFDELKAALTNHSLDAYIMDLPEIGYYVMSQNDDCAVRLLPKPYALIDFGFLFHKDFNTSAFTDFNRGLFISLEANNVERLANQHLQFLGALDKCTPAKTTAVKIQQLAGLWVILCGVIGVALLACVAAVMLKVFGKSVPAEERKLSSVFVSGASAKFVREASRSINGGGGGGGGGGPAALADGSIKFAVRALTASGNSSSGAWGSTASTAAAVAAKGTDLAAADAAAAKLPPQQEERRGVLQVRPRASMSSKVVASDGASCETYPSAPECLSCTIEMGASRGGAGGGGSGKEDGGPQRHAAVAPIS